MLASARKQRLTEGLDSLILAPSQDRERRLFLPEDDWWSRCEADVSSQGSDKYNPSLEKMLVASPAMAASVSTTCWDLDHQYQPR